jgi:hypothetical protein
MEVTTPFKLNDLPDNTWSVCWPGFEYSLVNNTNKAQHLLEILFETVRVVEVQLAVSRNHYDPDKTEIMHIDVAAWYQDKTGLGRYLAEFVVSGVKFATLEQAQHFKDHMDQRLAWKRLGGRWK